MDNIFTDLLVALVGVVVVGILAFVAFFRRMGRRGRIILGGALTLLILLACLTSQLGAIRYTLSREASPSDATLVAYATDTSDKVMLSGLSARDGSLIWRRPLDLFDPTGMVNDATIYLIGDAQANGAGPMVEALRLRDGAPLWRLALPATPTRQMRVVGGLLILATFVGAPSPSSEVIAVSLATHTLLWRASVPLMAASQGYSQLGASADLLFVGSDDGFLRALRLSDGSLAWKLRISATPTGSPGETVPIALGLASDGARLIVYDSTGEIASLRPADGATLWGRQIPIVPYEDAHVRLIGSSLYLCGLDPVRHTRALLALDPATGATRWSRDADCALSTPIASGADLYTLDDYTLSVLRVDDGAQVWRGAPEENDLGYTNLSSDAGAIFVATTIASFRSVGICGNWNPPSVTICHNARYIAAFDGATGQRYWRTNDSYDALITPEMN